MEWLRLNAEGEIEFVSEEVKLVPELQHLLSTKYNKQEGDKEGRKKYRALTELKYMYLVYSYKSPYRDYSDEEKVKEAKLDCGFPESWEMSTELQLVVKKYEKGSPSKLARLLKTTESVLDKLDAYYRDIDFTERDKADKLVYDPKEVMSSLKQLPGLAATLQELEQQVKLGHVGTPKSKGDHELGWMALDEGKKQQKGDED